MDDDDRGAIVAGATSDASSGLRLAIDWRGVAKGLSKGLAAAIYSNYASALAGLIDSMDAVRGKSKEPPTLRQQAGLLLNRATLAALAWTIRKSPVLTDKLADSDEEIEAFVQGAQAEADVLIDAAFFDHPAQSEYFGRIRTGVERWLDFLGADEDSRKRIGQRLAQEFPIALDLELRQRRTDYALLEGFFQPTLASDEAKRQRAWRRYRAQLIDGIRRPILNFMKDEPGAVSLDEIFVPLRAVYATPLPKEHRGDARTLDRLGRQNLKHTFVWLEEHVERWRTAQSGKDAFRILSGDPGCGKSAFGMMAASRWARDERRVLRVPLDLIDFTQDAFAAITGYAGREEVLGVDFLKGASEDDPLILILDGLDELSKVNEQSGAAARSFVNNLIHKINIENKSDHKARVLVLLAGRPIVTYQSTESFGEPGQRIDILRLKVDEKDYPNLEATDDLKADQRDDWWRKYGGATGERISGLPNEYRNKSEKIDDITRQPLLNYLLALIRFERLKNGQSTDVASVHALYNEIFDLLYRRRKGRLASPTQAEDRFNSSEYKQYLEEVAIAAWHNGDRSVTKKNIDDRFDACDANTRNILSNHFGSVESGVFAILNSFFVSPDGGAPGIYSFTHKSFREFLTAARLVREVETIHQELGRAGRYTVERALLDWYELAGPAPTDADLLAFVKEEIAARTADDVAEWRDMLTGLFNANLRDGMPGYAKAGTFREAEQRAGNAEAALFALLNACSLPTLAEGKFQEINWNDAWGLSDLLHRQRSLRTGSALVMDCLARANLEGEILMNANLLGANLKGANLKGAMLLVTNLANADLAGANLMGADLVGANLEDANLEGADLGGADLGGANLQDANLQDANLQDAILASANLQGANLQDANLAGANLAGANLAGANLQGANLEGANLQDANLERANLKGTIGLES